MIEMEVALAHRGELDAVGLVSFLGMRAVPGVESAADGAYRRSLLLEGGPATLVLAPGDGEVRCRLRLGRRGDADEAVARCRRLLDLDADVASIDAALAADPLLAESVLAKPGRRVPGTVDGAELAVRAVLGQQVSVVGARALAGRLVAHAGRRLDAPDGAVTHLFPTAAAVAGAGDEVLAMPAGRRRALRALAAAIDEGVLGLEPSEVGARRQEVQAALLGLPGIGPWTASYIAMRALGDGDAFLATDLGVRRAFERARLPADARSITARAERWRPYRAYAVQHLWAGLAAGPGPAEDRFVMADELRSFRAVTPPA